MQYLWPHRLIVAQTLWWEAAGLEDTQPRHLLTDAHVLNSLADEQRHKRSQRQRSAKLYHNAVQSSTTTVQSSTTTACLLRLYRGTARHSTCGVSATTHTLTARAADALTLISSSSLERKHAPCSHTACECRYTESTGYAARRTTKQKNGIKSNQLNISLFCRTRLRKQVHRSDALCCDSPGPEARHPGSAAVCSTSCGTRIATRQQRPCTAVIGRAGWPPPRAWGATAG